VGLQIGNRRRRVRRVGVALEVTPEVVEEALRKRWDLIVTHHPVFFRPPRSITTDHAIGAMALRLAEHRIAVYAAHTNLDFAPNGVSVTLAQVLGLHDIRFLAPLRGQLQKLAVFVPSGHEGPIIDALAAAGAGIIGEYSHCTFRTPGTGTFKASVNARPFIGARGQMESADEVRLEAVVPKALADAAIERVRSVHPYDEVAYDLIPLDTPDANHGMGAMGTLPRSMSLRAFVASVGRRLKSGAVRFAGSPAMRVRRIAVCGGSGSDLIGDAIRAGADAFVTADVKYHAFHGLPAGFGLIDAGHGETEQVILRPLAEFLRRSAATRRQHIHVDVSRVPTNPVQSL
jgi:dinuclear metal center YbgI/SA1388 family protein